MMFGVQIIEETNTPWGIVKYKVVNTIRIIGILVLMIFKSMTLKL